MMLQIEKKSYKELENEEGMDTLWAKLRVVLKATFMGQFLQEIELEAENGYWKKFHPQKPGKYFNG